MTFDIVKKAIEVQKRKGTLDRNAMMNKLDVFLLNGRISEEEYNEIAKMMMEEN
ncbi:MAG: hypothetical protein K2N26_09085 [Oscillospiraceae bacterium]|nr:hypothetical protein [Oscillospiraceae bacterium]